MKRPSISMFMGPILAVSLLAAGGLASATLAQSASPMATAGSPIVGAWLLDVGSGPGSAPTTGVFHADGTYIQTDGTTTGIGAWAATGPSTADMTFTQYTVDATGAVGGNTIRASVAVAADGTLSGTYSLEFVGPSAPSTGQMGPGTVTGTRIAVEPMATTLAPMGPPPSSAP